MAVSRLNQSFDHAAYYETYRIAGEVTKPRRAWVLDGDLSALGLPVFDADGVPLGVVSTVVSTIAPEGAGRTGPSALAGALDQRKTLGPVGIFMLPARPVAKAVELSLGRARELLRERQGAAAEAPAGDGGG
jgi:hypothetical protein